MVPGHEESQRLVKDWMDWNVGLKNATPRNLENCWLQFFENNQNQRIGIINSGYFKDLNEPMILIKELVKTGSSLGNSLVFQNVQSHSSEL
jgi:hypothetical protein